MNPLIFREYDVRGVADRDLTDELALDLGRAFGTFLRRRGNQRIVVGRDCRLSSPRLHKSLVKGLLETGVSLVDIGVGPTPMMYFAVFHLDTDGGVQITGSHNPPEDNGFKLMSGKQTLAGDEVRELRTLIEKRDFDLPGRGEHAHFDPLSAYAGYMRGNIHLTRTDLKFAIDAGNGAGGPAALAAMHALGLQPIQMYCEMDGAFPNHHPDPSLPENVEELVQRVRSEGLELGIAYDGDADRIGVVDDKGTIIYGDRLMILLSRQILKRHPGATILGEVKCSQTLYDDVAKHGGRGIIWKTGHSLIKKKMKQENAMLAGEVSGHIFFADRYYGYDDAIYASLRLLEIVAESGKRLSELLADVPETHVTPEIRVDCPDEVKFGVVDRVLAHYKATHTVLDVDGARVTFEGGWGLVRASNTQPALVLRFEAQSPARLDEIRSEVEAVVKNARG
ncbi:MAG TPA: phosphomannomutase/phosphoglucomutase [Polyangiales bacterium]|jgi:phosphomannomutase/phosphoglucomutase|nr:phosphomannomutase/phosphoglucomutase [Polyangiales bacterium]